MIELISGDDEVIECTVVDPDSTPEPNEPVDITSVQEITFIIKKSGRDTDDEALLTKTLADDIDLVTPMEGRFDVTLSAADTADLPIGTWRYGIQIVDSAGKTNERTSGAVKVVRDLVRTP